MLHMSLETDTCTVILSIKVVFSHPVAAPPLLLRYVYNCVTLSQSSSSP